MEVLSISKAQAYSLVRHRDLPAIQVGGRGQWRVAVKELHAYIDPCYAASRTSPPGPELADSPSARRARWVDMSMSSSWGVWSRT